MPKPVLPKTTKLHNDTCAYIQSCKDAVAVQAAAGKQQNTQLRARAQAHTVIPPQSISALPPIDME
jgi:hypothetical protein